MEFGLNSKILKHLFGRRVVLSSKDQMKLIFVQQVSCSHIDDPLAVLVLWVLVREAAKQSLEINQYKY